MHLAPRAAALLAAVAGTVLALGGPVAAESPSPSAPARATASPTPILTLPPVSPSPTTSPAASPTASRTPKPTRTASPTPSATRVRRTSSPAPRLTTAAPTSEATASPVDVGGVPTFDEGPSATPTVVKAKPAASKGTSRLSRIGWLVIGGAVLLGLGGGAGLYLTRHQV